MLKKIGILVVVIGLIVFVWNYKYINAYFTGKKQVKVFTEMNYFVTSSASLEQVATDLKEKGVIGNKNAFMHYAQMRNLKDATLEPGKYTISPGMDISDVVVNFRKGYGEKEVKVTFNNARTLQDFAGKITKNIELDSATFYSLITNIDKQKAFGFQKETFMTMFIPDTYRVYWDISSEDLLKKMAKAYKRFWNAERKQKAKQIGLSPSEVSTLASIVTTETAKIEEAPIIAGVYMNRIQRGIPLQADPTLIWSIGDFSIKRVLNKHKEIDSPYNTYMYAGLPPGPIYISSTSYMDAVLNYQKHRYLYFCAKEDFSGYSNFAETLSQHNRNAAKYQRALNSKRIFR